MRGWLEKPTAIPLYCLGLVLNAPLSMKISAYVVLLFVCLVDGMRMKAGSQSLIPTSWNLMEWGCTVSLPVARSMCSALRHNATALLHACTQAGTQKDPSFRVPPTHTQYMQNFH